MLGVGLVLLLISALVSGSEVAFFSLTPSDQQQMRTSGDRRDEAILALRSDVDALLATILVTNNLVNICIVILTSNVMDSLFVFARFEFLFKTVLVTFLLLLFGEILPKVFSQQNPRAFARMVVYPIKFFGFVTYPLAYVLVRTGGRLSRIASRSAEISMEELADAVDLTRTASPQEHQMLSGIVNFVNTEVEEIMRPRVDLTALDIKSSYEQVKRTIIESGYSRIPVYDEDLDNETNQSAAWAEVVDDMNECFGIRMYYDNTSTVQADLMLEPDVILDEWSEYTYFYYDVMPVICFKDGSKYSFEEYFTEDAFSTLTGAAADFVESYGDMFGIEKEQVDVVQPGY